MEIPKTVTIAGKTYSISEDKDEFGGSGETGLQHIVVGTKNSDERTFENFLHEVMECIACERNFRYGEVSEGCMIVMNHKEFDCFASDVSTAIRPIIKGFRKQVKK